MITRWTSLIVVSTLAVAACSGGGDDDAETTVPTTDAPETTTTTTTEPAPTTTAAPTTTIDPDDIDLLNLVRLPLTGQPVASSDDVPDRPALAVKIDNNPRAQDNHTGLAVADIVFEEIVENQDTRFAAVFHSRGADPVGPIRSGRSQDVDLLEQFNSPLFAWSGGNAGVTRLIDQSSLVSLSALNSDGYYRGPGRAPHNLYSTTDELWSQTPDDQPVGPPQAFVYVAPNDEFRGDPAESFDLQMRSVPVTWAWDEDEGRFARSQEGGLHIDATYGQIYADNIVVMSVDYRPSPVDSRSPEAQTVGQGRVFVFSNGQFRTGIWERTDASFPISLVDDDGRAIELSPGQTWVELAEAVGDPDAAWPLDLQVTPEPSGL